ncbi:NDP-hexose 2,3-dehydratase family protein [Streptosporangium sp. NPDC000509]|uniref:NDP-hexose 2,3-dehydratase family protein n=1 Tax=Streptosporangium sp. NPDC000509 TaxID=3366186 RepID=UPI00368AC99C
MARDSAVLPLAEFREWFAERHRTERAEVTRIPFADLDGWSFTPGSGNLVHRSGRFFSVEGLRVSTRSDPAEGWSQPIINQSEIGILGILAKEIDGVVHFLMQAKMEPGNVNSVQLSPTVQATHSNYVGVHRGAGVPYLEYFTRPRPGSVLVDVLQSEHGSWFWCKRNRNMVVEVTEDVEVRDGFRWLTIGQLQELLRVDNLVNMDSRTVLACVPFDGAILADGGGSGEDCEDFVGALRRSVVSGGAALHTTSSLLSWFTAARSSKLVDRWCVNLEQVTRWKRSRDEIAHEEGKYFTVAAVAVSGAGREVGSWSQPLFVPVGQGVVAFVVKRIHGVLHVLVHARMEGGLPDMVELAATLQCAPESYEGVPADRRPYFMDYVLNADRSRIRFESLLSEEGGRFMGAVIRYLVIEADDDFPVEVPEDYTWVTVGQLSGLLRHSYYLNVQARTLVACLQGLWGGER